MTLSAKLSSRSLVRAALLGATMLLIMPSVSSAGTYTVRACWGSENAGWVALPVHQGLQSHKGCPWTQAPTMLAGLNAWATKTGFATGSETGWSFAAPRDTRVTGFSAYSAITSNVTRSTWQLWNQGIWDKDTGFWIASVPESTDWTWWSFLGFSTRRLGIGMRCYMSQCGPAIRTAGPNAGNLTDDWVSFLQVSLQLSDDVKPTVVVSQPPPEGWQGQQTKPVTFTATDNIGVAVLYAEVDGMRIGTLDRGCYGDATNTSPLPCADPSPSLNAGIDPSNLVHGSHIVRLTAMDPGGNVSERTYMLLVDHNAPAAPRALSVRGGGTWRADNRFEVSWSNPPDSGESAITDAVYQLCPAANSPYDEESCVSARVTGENLTRVRDLEVPADGEWRLRLSLRDAAGNGDADRAATVEGLRLDTHRPEAAFLPFDPADPTRVRLRAADNSSGVSVVEIEVRRRGEAIWRSLTVDERAGLFGAVIDDGTLPDGRYDLRARVVDGAGNERTTMLLDDGRPLEIVLPVRSGTLLDVGRSMRVRNPNGKRPRYRRVLDGSPEASYGRAISLQGKLTDAARHPRAGASVEVLERVDLPGMEWRSLTTLRSDATGRIVFRAAPGPTRTLRFRYPGTPTTRPSTDEVELRVRAGITLVPSRQRLRNGQSVVFRGALLGEPIPAAGKLLALQALTARGWRTFATPRARGNDGRWSYHYHFTSTTATVRYAFRVLSPTEAGYPYARGVSRTARVLVRGG
jgi:hypothetical protein